MIGAVRLIRTPGPYIIRVGIRRPHLIVVKFQSPESMIPWYPIPFDGTLIGTIEIVGISGRGNLNLEIHGVGDAPVGIEHGDGGRCRRGGGGGGPHTTNFRALEPPPSGLSTVTGTVAGVAMSAAVMDACSWVADTPVVVLFAPFRRTRAPGTKLR